jgi:hypothetical protein
LGILSPQVKPQKAQILFGYKKTTTDDAKDVYKRQSITSRFAGRAPLEVIVEGEKQKPFIFKATPMPP